MLINPLLAAIEGNGRTFPTSDEVTTQLDEAVAKISRALPEATLMVGPNSNKGVTGLIEDMRSSLERKRALLLFLAPLLCSPIARREIDARWRMVLSAVDMYQVPRASLLVLALLSTLVHPSGMCAAKKIFKFHKDYSEGDAYNALSDFRALDLLVQCLGFFPEMDIQLCTADRNLALFWVGAGISAIRQVSNGVQFSLTPHPAVLPNPYGSRWSEDIGSA